MPSQSKKLIVDLESLFDMRQGVLLILLGPDKTFEITSSQEYFTRRHYDLKTPYGDLSYELYRSIIRKDPLKILQNSAQTRLMEFIVNRCALIRQASFNNPTFEEPEIVVNTHGFGLTEEESNTLVAGVRHFSGGLFHISVEEYSPAQLSPGWMNQHARALFTYDAEVWMEIHKTSLIASAPNKDFCVFLPKLMRGDENHPSVKAAKDIYKGDFFEFFERACAHCVQVSLLPASAFSADAPANPDHFTSV